MRRESEGVEEIRACGEVIPDLAIERGTPKFGVQTPDHARVRDGDHVLSDGRDTEIKAT